jgi:hypothetical protein
MEATVSKGPAVSKLDRVEVKAVHNDGREARADAGVAAGTPINPEPGVASEAVWQKLKTAGS